MIPSAVVVAESLDTVVKVLQFAHAHRRSVVFRAAGTSLSGQAQTDDLLVDVRKHWGGFEILEDGAAVRARPGAIIGHVNAALQPQQRVLGPDPASKGVACVGGVVSNNGQRYGRGHRAQLLQDRPVHDVRAANGSVIDTAAPHAEQRFAHAAPELAAGLLRIRDQLRGNSERVRHKYEIKNTNGYRLVAFLDGDTPPGDLPPPRHRLRRHPGVHRRGRLRHRAAGRPAHHRPAAVPEEVRTPWSTCAPTCTARRLCGLWRRSRRALPWTRSR